MGRRLFILDPDLQSTVGHSFQASVRVAEAGIAAGFQPYIFGNRHFSAAPLNVLDGAAQVIPFFKAHAFDLPDISNGRVWLTATFSDEPGLEDWELYLHKVLLIDRDYNLDADDIIYCHTLSYPVILGWLYFLLIKEPLERPTIYSLIYAKPENLQGTPVAGADILSILKKFKSEGLLGVKVLFHVETVRLRELYLKYGFDFPVFMGPIPDALFDTRLERQATATHITYFGEAREEKGFVLLPDIISRLQSLLSPEAFDSLVFNIQVSCNTGNDTDRIKAARAALKELSHQHNNIILLEEVPTDVYDNLIRCTDVAILPYDPNIYHTRGSGVAFEVLASGKVVVCSPDIDIAVTFAADQIITAFAYTPEEFARSILYYVRMPEKRKDIFRRGTTSFEHFAVRNFFLSLQNLHTVATEGGSRTRKHTGKRQRAPRRRICLYVPIAQFSGGNGFVQRAHIDALRSLGYFVVIVGAPWFFESPEYFKRNSQYKLMNRYLSDDESLRGCLVLFPKLRDDCLARGFLDKSVSPKWETMSHEAQASYYENVVTPGLLVSDVLKTFRFDVCLANYSFCMPLIESLRQLSATRYSPIVLETHDFHFIQNRLRRKEKLKDNFDASVDAVLYKRDEASEVAMAGQAECLLHISRPLARQYGVVDGVRQEVLRPYLTSAYGPRAAAPINQFETQDVFAFCGGSGNEISSVSQLHLTRNQSLNSIDLLFYGTGHPSNALSLVEFLSEALREHLIARSIRLFVAGDICTQLEQSGAATDLIESGTVVLLGRVDSIRDVVAASKVVVLYVSEGTGFPTRVIEVMGAGQAFTINHRALIDLSEEAANFFPVCQTPADMADDILKLLDSREARDARGAAGLAFYNTFFDKTNYIRQLASAIGYTASIPKFASVHCLHTEARFADVDVAKLERFFLPVDFGRAYRFDGSSFPSQFLIYDWSPSDGGHTWLDGKRGGLLIRTKAGHAIREIKFGASVFEGIFDKSPIISVLINNRVAFQRPFRTRYEEIYIAAGPEMQIADGLYHIEVRCDQTGRAQNDPRDLSVCMSFIEFTGDESNPMAVTAPLLETDTIIFGTRGNAGTFVDYGVAIDEDMHSWTVATRSAIKLQAPKAISGVRLRARALPELAQRDGAFTVVVNGRSVFSGGPELVGWTDLAIKLDTGIPVVDGVYRFEFNSTELGQAAGDTRELGWCLERMEVIYE